ncbi:uracil-DNA glycosylase [Solimonas aquatica]|uniref:uracil-DNA glycosylase n=1 Tax=Solimonas aquatica TaxID=489703 RepID=UPI000B875839|nr:uracil-DNA glycosylase [Solimonas aquatica]
MKSFAEIVEKIRTERGLPKEKVPAFDPRNGNESAIFLFLLEAPGAGAVTSGIVSFENHDQTAKEFQRQLAAAGISREQIAIWNTVPWYVGSEGIERIRAAQGSDIQAGLQYLEPVIRAMPNLRYIVLMGGAARRAHVFLSRITTARIVSCHHTSPKVSANNKLARDENIAVLRFISQRSPDAMK